MAVDFFQLQDNARRQTTRLLVMFGLSVIAIIIVLYFVVAIGMAGVEREHQSSTHHWSSLPPERSLWQPAVLLWVAGGTLVVVGLGSLYKIAELSAGGEHIALMLGGRLVNPQTSDLAERRLLNIVEEMALASGIPVPPVYVLDSEGSINAFAAGHEPGDAVVAVSAGALRYLNRDELQGVMGHEFSHILNGDMRLNLRLIGIVYGILVLAVIGYYTMRFAGAASSGDSKKSGGAAGVFMFGLVLTILGYVGVFFGNLIKSAISRQREYLADASSVQFTRNPGGIAGALKKIGGLDDGSRIHDAHANEISHMFFSDAFMGSFFQLFATHPPLADRIKAVEPDFDGRFPEVQPVSLTDEPAKKTSPSERLKKIPILGSDTVAAGVVGLSAGEMVRKMGRPGTFNYDQAGRIVENIPDVLHAAVHEPLTAQAVVFASLLGREDASLRTRQLQLLQAKTSPALYQHVEQLAVTVQALPPESRLPLVSLAVPALKMASVQQYETFRQIVDELVSADNHVDLFEYCVRTILFHCLDVHYGLAKPPKIRYRTVNAIAQPASTALSMLAYVGHTTQDAAERAVTAGAQHLSDDVTLVPIAQCTYKNFELALNELAQSTPGVKQRIIEAVTATVLADAKANVEECELLRAIASTLECPMPPMFAS